MFLSHLIHSPHIKKPPTKVLSCLRNVMDFEQLVLIQNPNKYFHTLWLVKWAPEWHLSWRPLWLLLLCWFSWSLFLKKAGHLAYSKFCYLSFLFHCEVCRLLVFMVLKLNCSLFGSHKVQPCLAYPLYYRKAGRILSSSLPGTAMVLAFACCNPGRRSWGELLAECPQH